jgi:hypothetical protein
MSSLHQLFILSSSLFLLGHSHHNDPDPSNGGGGGGDDFDVPAQEVEFVEDLKIHVLSVPIMSFEGDAILLQFPDPLNQRTTYRHLDPWDAIAEPVYETRGNDRGTTVVILNSYQDNIPAPKGDKVKRTYVVLRRAMQLDPRVYFVTYLYVT